MVLAAAVALLQSDLKRMLAWSTVSQVAIMLSAVGAGARDSAAGSGVLHLFAHAFFKALLFLVIGWLGVVAGGTAVARLRGSVLAQPLARIAFAVGLLALAGFPFLVGGTSKEHVLGSVLSAAGDGRPESALAAAALLLTVLLTAAYSTRAWLVVSSTAGAGSRRTEDAIQRRHAVAAPDVAAGTVDGSTPLPVEHAPTGPDAGALVSIGVLLLGTVLGSLVLQTDLIPDTGEAAVWLLLATLVLIALGAGAGRLLRGIGDRPAPRPLAFVEGGIGFDRAYRVLVAAPVLALARLVAAADDQVVNATARGAARLVDLSGTRGSADHEAERPATGLLWVLATAAVLGLIGVVAWR
jgi:NADH-quinone oxidoreductase subunit L